MSNRAAGKLQGKMQSRGTASVHKHWDMFDCQEDQEVLIGAVKLPTEQGGGILFLVRIDDENPVWKDILI